MNIYDNTYAPQPTPLCAAYAPLLPLLDTDMLMAEERAATREHVAGCAWCQREAASYDTLELAMRRHYGSDTPTGISLPPIAPPFALAAYSSDHIAPTGALVSVNNRSQGAEMGERSEVDTPPPASFPFPPDATPNARYMLPTGRFRALGAITAVALVLLFAGLLFSPLSPLGNGPQAPTTTITSTLAPGADQIVFANVAPWGTLTINGTVEPNLALLVEPVRLPPGRDTLVYQAAPFPTLRCAISAPAAASDTCPLIEQNSSAEATATPDLRPATSNTRIVDLMATIDHLSSDSLAQLGAAANHALAAYTSTTQVLPGDHYLDSSGIIEVATSAFPITLSFVLPNNVAQTVGLNCATFCGGPGPQMAPGDGLHISSFPVPQWTYTPPGGRQVTVGPQPSGGNDIDFAVKWLGSAWQVAVSPTMVNSTLCEIALAALPNPNDNNTGWATQCGPSANPAANGAISVVYSGQSGGPRAVILYRAGVIMTTDAGGVSLFPSLTAANAHEVAIAQQLRAQLTSA